MGRSRAGELLRRLERAGVAPAGEIAVAVELGAVADAPAPEPVLLLTGRALYARTGTGWARLGLDRLGSASVQADPTGMLSRYTVVDDDGRVFVDVAVPLVPGTFRARMAELAAGQPSRPTPAVVHVSRATVASRASAASLASAAALAGLRAQQGRTVRVA